MTCLPYQRSRTGMVPVGTVEHTASPASCMTNIPKRLDGL